MVKFGICSEIFKDWQWEKTCKFVKSVGYDGIEVAPFTVAKSVTEISAEQRKQIKAVAENSGLEIPGLHWLLVSPEGLSISTQDTFLREKTKLYFYELIKFCSDLGGKVMIIGSPKQRNVPEGMLLEAAKANAKKFFTDCAEIAKKEKVTLCLEPLSTAETNIFTTAEETLNFVRELDHPNFRMMLDVKAMSSEIKPIPSIIRDCKGYFKHVHVNDENKNGPGFGKTDFIPIAKALKEADYNGYVSVEVFDFSPGPEIIAERSITYLKSVFK
ncbi:MAG: sugar phosphate isomerase/epimerase family protein [Candidatus Firestonebacteria bacterium]